ncbi:tetratricopeptide repeat-containing sulfotransferase family protein [Ruegeria atlantica]|uniref:tetratricopeptide repeat-containing sulfotransferase family protein n=1 Tax=Ruegeria atlantica TaxID=81569 RepID=UPI00147FF1CA|nr:sulfotransferase [Ruegeria atlantica]
MQKADQLKAELSGIAELLQSGRYEKAFKRATKAAKKWPKAAALPRLAGLCAVQQQKFKLAQTFFERAWRLEPGNQDLIQNYGLSLVQGGESEAALRFIDKIEAKGPLAPGQQLIRALAALREHRAAEAFAAIEQVLEHQPENLQAYCLKADILDDMQHWNRALDVLTALTKQHPKFQYGQLRLAKAHVGLGHLDHALTHGRIAMELDPDHAETLQFMATLPNLSDQEKRALKARISKLIEADPANREAAAMLHFAAASLVKSEKDIPQEMQHLNQAHKLLRKGFDGWEDRNAQQCRAILSAPLPVEATLRSDLPRPIFVIGLPRSGTTLVERILSSHSGVQGLGELPTIHLWARKTVPSNWNEAQALSDFYFQSLPELGEGSMAFVDKAPGNYAYVGAMAQAFPNAVILNVERDPRDIALSMWRAQFGAGGLYFTHDLKWMAAEANRYQRYMRHWRDILPTRVHDIRYETLVNNLQSTAEKLAEVCDLAFEGAMVSPDKSENVIKTASNLQARQPVNTSSIGGWQAVADQFEPFVKGLDPNLWPEVFEGQT